MQPFFFQFVCTKCRDPKVAISEKNSNILSNYVWDSGSLFSAFNLIYFLMMDPFSDLAGKALGYKWTAVSSEPFETPWGKLSKGFVEAFFGDR